MSSQYKENNFSTESLTVPFSTNQNKKSTIVKPNIDHLLKRILVEKRRERQKITISIGIIILSITLISIFS